MYLYKLETIITKVLIGPYVYIVFAGKRVVEQTSKKGVPGYSTPSLSRPGPFLRSFPSCS